MNKKFFRFVYAAIKRYGDKKWTAARGFIEINTNYVVNIAQDERDIASTETDKPFIVELSNGTKYLMFLHSFGTKAEDEILSDSGEVANSYVESSIYGRVKRYINKYNNSNTI